MAAAATIEDLSTEQSGESSCHCTCSHRAVHIGFSVHVHSDNECLGVSC